MTTIAYTDTRGPVGSDTQHVTTIHYRKAEGSPEASWASCTCKWKTTARVTTEAQAMPAARRHVNRTKGSS